VSASVQTSLPLRLQQLPRVLADVRHSRCLSQKTVALSAGLDQSYLCSLERGRRPTPGPDIITRVITGLGADTAQASLVVWAAAHDRVLFELKETGLVEAADLVSAALLAVRRLSGEEMAGLVHYIRELTEGKGALAQLVERSRRPKHGEGAMT
jgi:transcriptional regulator with XRE-family HTH domain